MIRTRSPLLLIVLAFLACALWRLDVPLVNYDEAIYLRPAGFPVPELWEPENAPVLPLMSHEYVGAPTYYLLTPLTWVFGVSTLVLRLPAVLLLLAACGLWLDLVRRRLPMIPLWAPAGVMLGSSALLLAARQGLWGDVSLNAVLLAAGVNLLERRRVAAAGALLGLGVWSKLPFLFFLPPLAYWAWARRRRGEGAAFALGFAAGLSPLLLYNALHAGATFGAAWAGLREPALPHQASNAAVFSNLGLRLSQLVEVLEGGVFYAPPRITRAIAGLVPLAAALFAASRARERAVRRFAGATLVLCASYLVLSTLTVSARYAHHLLILLPPLLAAGGIGLAAALKKPGRLAVVLAALALPNAVHFAEFVSLKGVEQSAGNSARGLARLSAWLVERKLMHPVALDWGIRAPLYVISGGRVRAQEPPVYADPGWERLADWRGDKVVLTAGREPGAPYAERFDFGSPGYAAFVLR